MLGAHPFLHVNRARRVLQLVARVHLVDRYQSFLLLRVVVLLQIRLEMLQQGHLFLKFCRERLEAVLGHHVLLFVGRPGLALVVVEVCSGRLSDDLRAVVEEHTGRHVRQQIAKPVFGRIIDPFGHPNLRCLI